MTWMRLMLLALLLALPVACGDPTGPRYPEEDPPGSEPPDPPTQGLVVFDAETLWV
jgi:hypothetical protein